MARRILNRKDLRAANDAAERRQTDDEDVVDEEADDEDEDEEEEPGEADADAEAEGDEDEEEAPAKKKKAAPKVKAKPKPKAKPRSRTAKVVRMRVVWGVFNNSNQCVATYDFTRKGDAVEHATRLQTDKKQTHFIQPVKQAIAEEK